MYLVDDLTATVHYRENDIYTNDVQVQDLITGMFKILDKSRIRPFYLQIGDKLHFSQYAEYEVKAVYYEGTVGHYFLRIKLICLDTGEEHKVDETLVYGLMEKFFAE